MLIHIKELWKIFLHMQNKKVSGKECESCNQYSIYVYGFICDICGSQVCAKCIQFYLWNIHICDICAIKTFLIKITSPGSYDNVSRYETSVGKINIVNWDMHIMKEIKGTCTVCKRSIPTLKSNYASLRVHYKQKNKVRFICDGSRKLCLEIRRGALAGDMGRKT